jgi:hypothetical protein
MKTVINKQSGKVLFAIADWIDTETEIGIDEILTEYFVIPYFNQETRYFYEGATQEEIEQAFREKTPDEVQLWRLRTILKLNGLEQSVEIALDELEEPTKTGAKNVWNYGTTVARYSETVLFIQAVLEMTENEVDEIFQEAEAIVI